MTSDPTPAEVGAKPMMFAGIAIGLLSLALGAHFWAEVIRHD